MAGFSTCDYKAYTAESGIGKFKICKFGTTVGGAVQAAAAADKMMGVSSEVVVDSAQRVDIARDGLARVVYGGTVAAGDLLTSDASGNAVVTTTQGNRYLGIAEVAGVSGDIGIVLVCPGIV